MADTVVRAEAVLDLQVTTGIRGCDDLAAGCFDVVNFTILEKLSLFGLGNVVHTSAAAAPVGLL